MGDEDKGADGESLKGLPDPVVLPIPPGEQSMLEPPREEGDHRFIPPTNGLQLQQPPLKVSDSALRKGSEACGEVRTQFYKAAASLEKTTGVAEKEFTGLQTGSALQASHTQWEIQASNVVGWLAQIASSLHSAKVAYKSTDIGTESDLGGILPKTGTDDDPTTGTGPPSIPYAPRRSALDGID